MAPGRSRTGSGGASSLMPAPLEAKLFGDLGGLPMPHGPTQPFHQSGKRMPIALSRPGTPHFVAPNLSRRMIVPWRQTGHRPARSWRVSDRVTDTLAKGFGIRLIRTDPPESVDCSRCRALVKSQPGGPPVGQPRSRSRGSESPAAVTVMPLGLKHDLRPIPNRHRAAKSRMDRPNRGPTRRSHARCTARTTTSARSRGPGAAPRRTRPACNPLRATRTCNKLLGVYM